MSVSEYTTATFWIIHVVELYCIIIVFLIINILVFSHFETCSIFLNASVSLTCFIEYCITPVEAATVEPAVYQQ